jgi:hypothetical protein
LHCIVGVVLAGFMVHIEPGAIRQIEASKISSLSSAELEWLSRSGGSVQSAAQEETYMENSPSLCPTMSSVTVNSWYTMPLCTWNRSPTKLGKIVADRACVLIAGAVCPGLTFGIASLSMVSGRLAC